MRVGTLDRPGALPPDIHIFTASKQAWVALPAGAPAVSETYERGHHWPAASLVCGAVLLPAIEAHQRGLKSP